MLTEFLQDKNINLTKLAELTGISERYLKALVEEKYDKLPPAPYVRSYLFKISQVLGLDGQKLWQEYQKNTQLKKSGVNDRLPLNRFRPLSLGKKTLFWTVLIVVIFIYLILRYNFVLGKPTLALLGQLAGNANLIVSESIIKIEGRIKPGDQLTINQEKVDSDQTGYFKKDFSLQGGLNIVQFRIKRFLGREINITKQVLYIPD